MSDNTEATINRILELAPAGTLDIEGFTHIDKDKRVVLFEPPTPSSLQTSTLTGIVDLLENGFEGWANAIVHVQSPESVEVIGKTSDKWGRRRVYLTTKRVAPDRSFSFNTYMAQENFVIGLRSLFAQDVAVDDLVSVAGNLATQAEVRQQDDGFTQNATMKAGVIRLAEKTINPRVTLTPYRTFLEAVQPSSDYIFRIQADAEEGAKCALFDADAGNWRLQAIQNVQAWLQNQLKGSTVEGVADIPVIA